MGISIAEREEWYKLSQTNIRKWIELSLKQRDTNKTCLMKKDNWQLNLDLLNIQSCPTAWFTIILLGDTDNQCRFAYFAVEKNVPLSEVKRNRTIPKYIPFRKDMINTIEYVSKVFLEELKIHEREMSIKCGMPDIVYHATFRKRLPSIKNKGLTTNNKKTYEISQPGVIYLAPDPYMAESFCEAAEDVTDSEYDSGIIVFAISRFDLDTRLIGLDRNMKVENIADVTYTYARTIQPQHLTAVKSTKDGVKAVGILTRLKRVPSFS